jgi:hypothetical protein
VKLRKNRSGPERPISANQPDCRALLLQRLIFVRLGLGLRRGKTARLDLTLEADLVVVLSHYGFRCSEIRQ